MLYEKNNNLVQMENKLSGRQWKNLRESLAVHPGNIAGNAPRIAHNAKTTQPKGLWAWSARRRDTGQNCEPGEAK